MHSARYNFVEDQTVDLSGELRPEFRNLVQSEIEYRDLREKLFGGEILRDPTWDMLLALYRARLDHENMAVTSLVSFGRCPQSTALRYLEKMINASLAVRVDDPNDGRRSYVYLSLSGTLTIETYLKGPRNSHQ